MVLCQLLLLSVGLVAGVQGVLSPPPPGYDDDTSPLPLRLEDLEQEQEQHQHLDLNRPPLLPNHYEWRPDVAASLPPSYIQDAAQRERNLEQLQRLEELRQLQRQHQQLSSGYAFPAHLPGVLYVGPTTATPTPTPSPAPTRFVKPIVPYDLDLSLNSIQYVTSNALPLPVPRPLPPPHGRQPFVYGFTKTVQGPGRPTNKLLVPQPLVVQQSKQFAYAPATPAQRHYANGPRIPFPYPPSFVSITTRRPGGLERIRPFRPSQPDPTPDLFAGRSSKSLLDSYIPSWEVLRLIREHSPQQQGGFTPIQHRQTLAFPAPAHLRLYKRDSQEERSRIVKKSLGQPGKVKAN
ncbi:uncharacterized protein LOC128265129 [Drosophila gunungcola]|uniref:uncharacterized protein LOC128265129 n=1 Tax=Drosophila gunungcola TaxID=103775 RepID=UPI0022E5FE84|nr:uncharacterized protein LOC128265129 [Drosophila gunungcola]XP_052856917.1 uncharacterized protein LOC128265129 [Drosophila gunungcola]